MRETYASTLQSSSIGLRAREVLPAMFTSGAALSVYLFTLAPTITFGDSGELITAAHTLGIAHPPGYPLWLLLGKCFSFLPIGSVAYRLNLMSAILDAAAVGLLALVVSRTLPSVCAGIVTRETMDSPVAGMVTGSAAATASLCLAFSPTFWQQAVVAEVYALNNLLICAILLLLTMWGDSPERDGLLLAGAFLFGAGQANHQTLLLLAPAIVLYVILVRPRIVMSARVVSGCVLLFLLGLGLYLYLPIRAAANPPLNWGNPSSWENFWFLVTRKQYRSLELLRSPATIFSQIEFFFTSLVKESIPVVLLLPAALCLWFTRRKGALWLVFTAAAFLCGGVLLVVIANTELDLNAQSLLKVYFIPSFIMLSIWVGYGIGIIGLLGLRASRRLRREPIPVAVFAALWLAVPASNVVAYWTDCGMRGKNYARLYGDALMNRLPENAILFAGTDSAYSIPMYMKWVQQKRQDISILSVNRLADPSYAAEASRNAPDLEFLSHMDYQEAYGAAGAESKVRGAHDVNRVNGYLLFKLYRKAVPEKRVFYDEGLPIEWAHDFAIPSGLIMELKSQRVESLPPDVVLSDFAYWDSLEGLLMKDERFLKDKAARARYSKCRSNLGALYLHHKMYAEAEAALNQAMRFSDLNIEAYASLALAYREQGRIEDAVRIFDEYLQRDAWNTSAHAFARSLREPVSDR
ncbi:MAG: hypothetical protein Kow0099_01110 [Candidatus Abyssubacteria bacterium]